MDEKLTMIIASDSCDGKEEQFKAWMNKNHPAIETKIEDSLHGGLANENGDMCEQNFWDQYCSEIS